MNHGLLHFLRWIGGQFFIWSCLFSALYFPVYLLVWWFE